MNRFIFGRDLWIWAIRYSGAEHAVAAAVGTSTAIACRTIVGSVAVARDLGGCVASALASTIASRLAAAVAGSLGQ